MYTLVLVRHGESIWNAKNLFTGWEDVDLSEKGIAEIKRASRLLHDSGFTFDVAFTSLLKRAHHTLSIILEDLTLTQIPVHTSWRLNERHYGALQGLDKDAVKKQYGEEQFKLWRRSYDVTPPLVSMDDPRFPGNDPKYKNISTEELPRGESLKDTGIRFIPYWQDTIVPEIKKGKKVIIAAHGNTLRVLMKSLDNVSDQDIVDLNLETGLPVVYELDETLKPIKHYYLKDNA